MKNKKQIITTLLSVLLPVLLVSAVAYATTVGNDVSVGNDLTVTGISTLTGTTTLTGALVANGNIALGNAAGDIVTIGGTITPVRTSDAYAYGVAIGSATLFTGTTSQKSYMLYVAGNRPVTSEASGDSNDAIIRASFNNYAANDANFIMRGVNSSLANRSGGVLGRLEAASFGAQGESGGTASIITGLTITSENYGTVTDEFSGIKVDLRNEGAVATTEYGIHITNSNVSLATAVDAGIMLSNSAVNTGFAYGIDMNGVDITTADVRLSSGANIMTGNVAASGACTNGSIYLNASSTDANTALYACIDSVWRDIATAKD